MSLSDLGAKLVGFACKNAPQLFAGVGVVAFIGAVATATKVAPIVNERCADILESTEDKKEMAKRAVTEIVPMYAPTCALICIGTVAIVRSQQLWSLKTCELSNKLAAEMAAYSITEEALRTYQGKVIERFGEEEHSGIINAIAEEKVERVFDKPESLALTTRTDIPGQGDTLVYDGVLDKVFWSTKDALEAAKGAMSNNILNQGVSTLTDFYYELCQDGCGSVGDCLGWTSHPNQRPNLTIGSTLKPDGKVPKMAIYYDVFPLYGGQYIGGCSDCLNQW